MRSDTAKTKQDGSAAESTIASAGKIHMLGLEAIKNRLGPKWNRMSELVHRYFETAIRQQLRPGDTFNHVGELTYLVLIRDVTIAEAQLKCTVAIGDVCRRLFGDGENVSIRSLVAAVDDQQLESVQDQWRLNELLEATGREAVVNSDGGLPSGKDRAALRVHMASAPEMLHNVGLERPCFVYRPLWDTSRNVVLTYLCQSLPDTFRPSDPFRGPVVATDGEDDQAAIDVLALSQCLQRVSTLRRAGLRVLLAAPIHFSTLLRHRTWTRYSEIANSATLEHLRDIAFLVHGFEAGVPNARLVEQLPKLSRFSKNLYCLTDYSDRVGAQFRNTGVHAVGFTFTAAHTERYWIERMRSLARETSTNGLEAFVLGVSTRSAAVNAIGVGVRYVEGPSVRRTVVDPKHAYIHEIEDLYKAV